MDDLGLWFGFAGAWLLFVGPIYQAHLELEAEAEAQARFQSALGVVQPPPPISGWWWLVPPVMLVLSSRRRNAYQRAVREAMSADDLAVVARYVAVFRGWLCVAAGAWLIFVKETSDLLGRYEIEGPWMLGLLVVVTTALGILVTVGPATSKRSRAGTDRPPAPLEPDQRAEQDNVDRSAE